MMELKRLASVAVERPMGGSAAMEVLALRFDTEASPSEARMALDDLTKLHSEEPLNVFCKAMERIHPQRKQALRRERLLCDQLPLVRLRVENEVSLAHIERFFERGFKREIELFLHVRMPQAIATGAGTDLETERACEFLSRLADVLENIQRAESHVKLEMVELVFGAFVFDDDSVTRAASRVCALALCGNRVPKRFKVALLLARTGPKRPHHSASLSAWGELLQSVCRISSDDKVEEQMNRRAIGCGDLGSDDERDCNSLHVNFSMGSDTRLIAAFWSAVAFSRGISSLHVDEMEVAKNTCEEDNQLRARYTALALGSSHSNVRWLSWLKPELSAYEVEAMEQTCAVVCATTQLQAATAPVLWSRSWNLSREGHIFQVETLNTRILEAYAILLHDPGEREWIDLMVPGYGQCSIKRHQWSRQNIQQLDRFSPMSPPTLRHVELQLKAHKKATITHLGKLFRIVGSTLTSLNVQTWAKSIKADGLLAILTSCPQLRALAVTVKVSKKAAECIPSQIVARYLKKLSIVFARLSNAHNAERLLCDLLPLIRTQLEEVEIQEPLVYVSCPRVLETIMTASKGIKQLTLHHIDVGSLDPIIDAFREQRTALKSLRLNDCRTDRSSLANFGTYLAYSRTQQLEKFRFEFSRDDQEEPVLDKTALLEFLSMLGANKTLQTLHFSLGEHQRGFDHFKKHFITFDGQALPIQCNSIPLEATLALLSALYTKKLPQNQDIVELIVGFAASRVKRVVVFETTQ